jgi:3-phosphoshikimate 1-carboxyvinyltransferase
MDLEITPLTKSLNGEIIAPGSKSYSHRAFITASLAEGISIIKNPLVTGDAGVTIDILRSLGVKILKVDGNSYVVENTNKSFKKINKLLDCKNSGTSARIFSAIGLLLEEGLSLTGEFFTLKRPILPLLESLKTLGAEYELKENKLQIKPTEIICEKIMIPGDITSQFITALLIVCPLLKCKKRDYIEIEVTTPIVSVPYIRITLDVLNSFGINIQEDLINRKFFITTDQNYRAQVYDIPGDFSASAFIIAAAVLSKSPSKVTINNLSMENSQGDKYIIDILKKMGAHIEFDEKAKQVTIYGDLNKNPLHGLEIDCSDTPDLVPILSIIGSFAKGKTVLYNTGRLKLKESDRSSAMVRELTNMGVKVLEENDRLTIYHCDKLKGVTFNHERDHRVAMACTIAALFASTNSIIKDIDIVKDSYPTFLEDLEKIGIPINFL